MILKLQFIDLEIELLLYMVINPTWAAKKRKVNKEQHSEQITRIQDDCEEAQVHNSRDEHKTPESQAIETDDINDANNNEDDTYKSNEWDKQSEPVSSSTNVAG